MMKKRRSWTRFFSGLLILSLLLSLPLGASAEETAEPEQDEWNSENSILVYWTAPEFRTFSPEDFPEIDCRRVVVAYRGPAPDGNGINFTLVLVLKEEGDEAVSRALEIARQDERTRGAKENDWYEKERSRAVLNHSQHILKLGETLDLEMVGYREEEYCYSDLYFTMDTSVEGYEDIVKNYYFYSTKSVDLTFINGTMTPHTSICIHIKEVEGESGKYRYENDMFTPEGPPSDLKYHLLEIADFLAKDPNVLYVKVYTENRIPPGTVVIREERKWEIDNSSVAQLSAEEGTKTTVQGIQPGTATVTFTRTASHSQDMTATCTVTVIDEYQQGDIDRNLDVGASDALRALQHSVNLITLDEEQQGLADMDENGVIDAADALIILQITVGLV